MLQKSGFEENYYIKWIKVLLTDVLLHILSRIIKNCQRTHQGDLVCVYHFILGVQIVLAVIKLHDRIFYVLDYMDRL